MIVFVRLVFAVFASYSYVWNEIFCFTGESESYAAMPVIFFLTNNGLLVSFHMINAKKDAVSLVYPAVPLNSKKEVENSKFIKWFVLL